MMSNNEENVDGYNIQKKTLEIHMIILSNLLTSGYYVGFHIASNIEKFLSYLKDTHAPINLIIRTGEIL